MAVFFGTDGIRGLVNDELTYNLAYKCGNATACSKEHPTILIGRDTRTTGSFLTIAFAGGATAAGANVIDVGICPTAGIAYLTKKLQADYGVVISASHNKPAYNGIKIFDKTGAKLGDKNEELLERKFINEKIVSTDQIGTYIQDCSLTKLYENHLIETCDTSLQGLTIVLDGSNGAAYKIAPYVFRKLGAKIIATHCHNDGKNINENCGSTHPETLAKNVIKYKANMGFAFDGDSDRIIACDELGNILDGDIIIYILAKYLKEKNELNNNTVVGTRHTNIGIKKALDDEQIQLLRVDIGDKYVIQKMEEKGISLGGEKSGHIILKQHATTGDGILTGIKIAQMVQEYKSTLSSLSYVKLCPQIDIDCIVNDKIRIINSQELTDVINKQEMLLGENSRIMVRVSGTEPKIRIMVEYEDREKAYTAAKIIEKTVMEINK